MNRKCADIDSFNSFIERREEVYLSRSVFGEICRKELQEIDKHEIVAKICDKIGTCPTNFKIAEDIFEDLKFEFARYVLHHEYCTDNGVRSKLLLWLDSRINPDNAEKLTSFFNKYLK